MTKIIAVDFCDTLVKGQTFDLFLREVAKSQLGLLRKVIFKIISSRGIYYILKAFSINRKFILLYLFKGVHKKALSQIAVKFAKYLEPNTLVLSLIQEYVQKGYDVLIVSAGLHDYIKYVSLPFHFEIISNSLDYYDNKLTGRITDIDCYGSVKLQRLLSNDQWRNSQSKVSISDHMSDKPLFDSSDVAYFYDSTKDELIKLHEKNCS